MKRRVIVVPAVITILAAAAVCFFILQSKGIKARLSSDLFTPTYQFLLVTVLGSGVSVVFQMIAHEREVMERRRVLQRELHQALVTGYNDAKRARRLLRARARLLTEATLDAVEYDRQLESLSSAQLSIELATRRIEMNRKIFPRCGDLVDALHTVARYLNAVVDEWEEVRARLGASTRPLLMIELPELDTFLQPYQQAPRFREGFKTPFDTALRLLEEALVADL